MILRLLSAVALSYGVAGCGYAPVATDRMLTVAEVEGHVHYLNGKHVRVKGWLGLCSKRECSIFASHEHLLAGGVDGGFLGIAASRMVDEAAKDMAGKQVWVSAIVSDECRGWTNCLDRAADLYVTDMQLLSETAS